jgi:signal peptidase I
MRPTLEVGDFILVNKFIYGLRLPIIEKKVIPLGDPQRGDVVVFRYPVNPTQDFIKRVVGVGGDVVEYRDKQIRVNGEPWPQKADGTYSYLEGLRFDTLERRLENHGAGPGPGAHDRGQSPGPARVSAQRPQFSGARDCDYPNERGFTCRGACGPLPDDGRQPGQQRLTAVTGDSCRRPYPRQGVFHLVQLGRHCVLRVQALGSGIR